MILSDILSLLLRLGELAFSAVVAGLTGQYLHANKDASSWSKGRFIYTEVVAAIGILFSLLFLLPFAGSFIHWPVDLLLFILYMIAFGLLASVRFISSPLLPPLPLPSLFHSSLSLSIGRNMC